MRTGRSWQRWYQSIFVRGCEKLQMTHIKRESIRGVCTCHDPENKTVSNRLDLDTIQAVLTQSR